MDDQGATCSMKGAYRAIITDNILFPARVNSVVFYLFMSIASFFVFVMQGGDLIIGIPFVVGSLFPAYTV